MSVCDFGRLVSGPVLACVVMLYGAPDASAQSEEHVPPADCPHAKSRASEAPSGHGAKGPDAGHPDAGHPQTEGHHHGAGDGREHDGTDRATMSHRFSDVDRWVKMFDDPERDEWQKPEQLVGSLGLQAGQVVAEIGAGTGYLNSHWARAVGDTGTVYAMDVEPNLVTHMRDRADRENLSQVVPILGSLANPRLPRGAADLVALVDVYHHIDHRRDYFRDLRATLRPGGRLLIVDFEKKEAPVGPPLAHKIPREDVVSELISAGYRLVGEPTTLAYQYVLLFEPTER